MNNKTIPTKSILRSSDIPTGGGVLITGGLPLGFGGGAPRKSAESDPSKPPVALRGLRLSPEGFPFFLVDVLPGGLPRFTAPRGYDPPRLVLAYWRVLFLLLCLRRCVLADSVIFGIIAQWSD